MSNWSPFLWQQDHGTFFRGVNVTLTGAVAPGHAGNVAPSDITSYPNWTPLGLSMQERFFTPKSVGDVQTTLTGAQANAQAEELVGSDITVYVDDD